MIEETVVALSIVTMTTGAALAPSAVSADDGRIVVADSHDLDPEFSVHITSRTDDGRRVTFRHDEIRDWHDNVRLDYGYAMTIASAQGLTVDRAFLLVDDRPARETIYPAATRHREALDVYVNRSPVAFDIADRRPEDEAVALSPAFRETLDRHGALMKQAASFRARPRVFELLLSERAGIGEGELQELRDVHARASSYLRSVTARAAHAARQEAAQQREAPPRDTKPPPEAARKMYPPPHTLPVPTGLPRGRGRMPAARLPRARPPRTFRRQPIAGSGATGGLTYAGPRAKTCIASTSTAPAR